MKKYYFLLLCFLTFGVLSAQEKLSKEEQARREKNIQAGNPFAKFGYKGKVATLSKGKYLEVHDLDSIVTIGSIRYHVDKKQIVGNIVIDTTDMYARPIGDTPSRWLSPDPLSEEFPDWSPYTMSFNNPIKYFDPDGRAPVDIVYFNTKGQETYRIKSSTIFKTYVEDGKIDFSRPNIFHTEAQMPNIIQYRENEKGKLEDVSGSKYQANDYQIAASTYLTNQELNSSWKPIVSDRNGNIVPNNELNKVSNITVDQVKAWSMQESHAGVGGSILQVNNNGDFNPDKLMLGITKGATFSAHQEINLAIRYAIGKGFTSTPNYAGDGSGTIISRNWSWNGWTKALNGYNGNGVPNYARKIQTMVNESKEPKPSNY
ncbi:MAG: hypothetical protein ACOVOQ_08960 [Flavobacterium sp.]